MSKDAEKKVVGLGKVKVKDLQKGMFEYVVADYEFERNKAIGGVLGGQERADEMALIARDANEEELKEYRRGVAKIYQEAKKAEDEYEEVVRRLLKETQNELDELEKEEERREEPII